MLYIEYSQYGCDDCQVSNMFIIYCHCHVALYLLCNVIFGNLATESLSLNLNEAQILNDMEPFQILVIRRIFFAFVLRFNHKCIS